MLMKIFKYEENTKNRELIQKKIQKMKKKIIEMKSKLLLE